MVFGDASAASVTDATIKALPQGLLSSVGYPSHDTMAAMPNSLLTITLASNFGTFLLYALSCVICMVAFHNHPMYKPLRHLFIPLFGLVANLACMAFYLIGPFMGFGTPKEPLLALGIAAVWAVYGGAYFVASSKKSGRTTLVGNKVGSKATA
jgi:amino acid transporter